MDVIKIDKKFEINYRIIKLGEVEDGKNTCIICNRNFKGKVANSRHCNQCKLEIQCPDCNTWIETSYKNFNRMTKNWRCKKCSLSKIRKDSQKPGNCVKCDKFNNKRSISGLGYECGCINTHNKNAAKKAKETNTKPGNCTICGKFNNKRSITGIGYECGCNSKQMALNGKKTTENN